VPAPEWGRALTAGSHESGESLGNYNGTFDSSHSAG
jgi:hypothetical protein